jgi:hypothetical protein
VTKPSKEAREYLASIGSKGGQAKGKRKARSPEHYAKMVKARKAKRTTGGDAATGRESDAPALHNGVCDK